VVVLATRYGGNIEPVSLEVSEGETGIPIFETVADAKEFDQGYREVLGPSLEARELPDQARA
jgi:hypothetical protein